jgi:hypothetical protein
MQKWEYLIETGIDESEMNRLGKEGWELIGIAMSYYGVLTYAFKRPIA